MTKLYFVTVLQRCAYGQDKVTVLEPGEYLFDRDTVNAIRASQPKMVRRELIRIRPIGSTASSVIGSLGEPASPMPVATVEEDERERDRRVRREVRREFYEARRAGGR